MTTTTPNAQIRWTNDGSEPSATNSNAHLITSSSGPAYGSDWYSVTFRAIAFKAGLADSDESSEEFYYDAESGVAPLAGAQSSVSSSEASNSPLYDANGNLKNYKGWTYAYDAQNRLTSARNNGALIATFYYDGKNRQIARYNHINNVARFSVWDGWELIEEYSGGMQQTAGYLQGATGVIKSWGNNGTIYYYQDKLGSTTHVANASGTLLESYRYDLYGTPSYYNALNTQLSTSNYSVNDLYAGERWVSELSLYDLRNRFMSPELGRFLQADPIGFKGDGSNLYRYCGNDPIDKSDPMGLENPPARILPDRNWEAAKYWDSASNFQGAFSEFMQRFQPAGLIMARVETNEAEKGRLMPLPPDLLTRMYATQQENAEQASDKANWTPIQGTSKRQQEEYSTTIYRRGGGLEQIGPKKGYHVNGQPYSDIYGRELKGGGIREAGTHIHVTGNRRHHGVDVDRARENRFISGVGHVSTPNILNIYVPPRSGQGPGAFYHTNDGVKLYPGEF
jgi:RHS repeat-associated protein